MIAPLHHYCRICGPLTATCERHPSSMLPVVAIEPRKKPLARSSYSADRTGFRLWENAVAGRFGGIVTQWPEWTQRIYEREH
jgi:hypothetical protein